MEQPPAEYSKSYFTRILQKFDLALQDTFVMPRLTAVPTKPIIGKQYYFNNVILPNITAEGVWVYKSTGWSYLG